MIPSLLTAADRLYAIFLRDNLSTGEINGIYCGNIFYLISHESKVTRFSKRVSRMAFLDSSRKQYVYLRYHVDLLVPLRYRLGTQWKYLPTAAHIGDHWQSSKHQKSDDNSNCRYHYSFFYLLFPFKTWLIMALPNMLFQVALCDFSLSVMHSPKIFK